MLRTVSCQLDLNILVKLHVPYLSEKTKVTVRNEIVEIKAFQIYRLGEHFESRRFTMGIQVTKVPSYPAILDVGTTHNFALTKAHLLAWAGLHADDFPRIGKIRKDRENAHLCKANVWLHADALPFALEVHEGIAIFDGEWPRLPVLGLRALTNSKLQSFIYGDTKRVVIRTPPRRYWPF
jgi:hypothetical protein